MNQDFVNELLEGKDQDCPCCGRYAKVYKRTITSTMARFLVWLDKLSGDAHPWVSPAEQQKSLAENRVLVSGGDHAKLRYWGLLEERPADGTEKGKTSGQWRITLRGREFVRDELDVPKYTSVLFGEPIDWSEETIGIRQALGQTFNYEELMNR